MGSKFIYGAHSNPIIAAVKNEQDLAEVVNYDCNVIFLLSGNVFSLHETVKALQGKDKTVFIHVDLIDGISNDTYGLEYIVKKVKPDGIISTKGNLILAAKELGVFTIQRLFILDSLSYQRSIHGVKKYKPDAIEILPGIMHKITQRVKSDVRIPVIAGGLIKDKEDVISALKAGAIAVSSTSHNIWSL
jgi:glycerol uptake operon antiterminator